MGSLSVGVLDPVHVKQLQGPLPSNPSVIAQSMACVRAHATGNQCKLFILTRSEVCSLGFAGEVGRGGELAARAAFR